METCPLCGKPTESGFCFECGGTSGGYEEGSLKSGFSEYAQDEEIRTDRPVSYTSSETGNIGNGTYECVTDCSMTVGKSRGRLGETSFGDSREVSDLSELSPSERVMVEKAMDMFERESRRMKDEVLRKAQSQSGERIPIADLIFSRTYIVLFGLNLLMPFLGIGVWIATRRRDEEEAKRVGNAIAVMSVLELALLFIGGTASAL